MNTRQNSGNSSDDSASSPVLEVSSVDADNGPVDLRVALRTARKAIAGLQRQQYESAICSAILEQLPTHPITIASYIAIDGEVNLGALHTALFSSNTHRVVLPAIDASSKTLTFHHVDESTRYAAAALGTQEPIAHSQAVAISDISFMLLPCVGVDRHGNRLGFGAGFYDRTLGKAHESNDELPFLIGVAFEAQLTSSITAQDWDIPVQAIVTETGWRPVDLSARHK